jgi:hypothetical protein
MIQGGIVISLQSSLPTFKVHALLRISSYMKGNEFSNKHHNAHFAELNT